MHKHIRFFITAILCTFILTGSNFCTEKATAEPAVLEAVSISQSSGFTSPQDVVNTPKLYLGKTITMNAKFDKFSTLGLDYKTAYRSSEDYISFLILRDDTIHEIPLSEMKLFLKREIAEKFVDLGSGDKISITGNVFSDALGDPWIDVTSLRVIEKFKKDGVNK